jgi:hypothetical protein
MTTRTTSKLVGVVVGAVAVAASLGSAAEARIPEDDWGDPRTVREQAVAVPDAFERAVVRQARKRVAAATTSSSPDWFERAALRSMRA